MYIMTTFDLFVPWKLMQNICNHRWTDFALDNHNDIIHNYINIIIITIRLYS